MKKAFTLIELLVVIAIIGILATLGTYSFLNSKSRANDATRKSDLEQIKSTLVLYYHEQKPRAYNIPDTNPAPLTSVDLARAATGLTTEYLKTFPLESKYNDTKPYVYRTSDDGQNFALFAELENDDSDIKNGDPVAGARPTDYSNCFWLEND